MNTENPLYDTIDAIYVPCHTIPPYKHILRAISILLIILFTWQQITWAQGGAPITSITKPDPSVIARTRQIVAGTKQSISIPQDKAITKEVNILSSDEVIINIQDAHDSLSAQHSIVDILDTLVKEYNLSLVALEGSTGYIDTSLLKTFPIEDIRKNVAEDLMSEGQLSAGEFFSIVNEKDIHLYGIEDNKLYREHVDSFCERIEDKAECVSTVELLLSNLEEIEENIYPDSIKELNKKHKDYKDGSLSFKEYWEYIKTLNKDYHSYPNLKKLSQSIEIEKQIGFNKANRERKALIQELKTTLPKEDLELLLVKSLQYKLKKISPSTFHQYLLDLIKRHNINTKSYQDLITYTKYITIYEDIEIVSMFGELEHFQDEIKDSLLKTQDQKTLNTLKKEALILKDLFSISLTNGRLKYLLNNIDDINPDKFITFIEKYANGDGAPVIASEAKQSHKEIASVASLPRNDIYRLFSSINESIEFYYLALERDKALINNTLKRMRDNNQRVAAMVTGGFHTEGITDILKNRNTSYIVLVPKFDKDQEKRPYVAILTKRTQPYKELLDTGKYQLATTSHFASGVFNPTSIADYFEELICNALDRAQDAGYDPITTANIWLATYETVQNSLIQRGLIKEGQELISRVRVREIIEIYTTEYRKFVERETPTAVSRLAERRMLARQLRKELEVTTEPGTEDEPAGMTPGEIEDEFAEDRAKAQRPQTEGPIDLGFTIDVGANLPQAQPGPREVAQQSSTPAPAEPAAERESGAELPQFTIEPLEGVSIATEEPLISAGDLAGIEKILREETEEIYRILDRKLHDPTLEARVKEAFERKEELVLDISEISERLSAMFLRIATAYSHIDAFGRLRQEIEAGNLSQVVVMNTLNKAFLNATEPRFLHFARYAIDIPIGQVVNSVPLPLLSLHEVLQSDPLHAELMGRPADILAIRLGRAVVPDYLERQGYTKRTITASLLSDCKIDGLTAVTYSHDYIVETLSAYYDVRLHMELNNGELPDRTRMNIPVVDNARKAIFRRLFPQVSVSIDAALQEQYRAAFIEQYYDSLLEYFLKHESTHLILDTNEEIGPNLVEVWTPYLWHRILLLILRMFKPQKFVSPVHEALTKLFLVELVPEALRELGVQIRSIEGGMPKETFEALAQIEADDTFASNFERVLKRKASERFVPILQKAEAAKQRNVAEDQEPEPTSALHQVNIGLVLLLTPLLIYFFGFIPAIAAVVVSVLWHEFGHMVLSGNYSLKAEWHKIPYVPLIRIPSLHVPDSRGWQGILASFALLALGTALLCYPTAMPTLTLLAAPLIIINIALGTSLTDWGDFGEDIAKVYRLLTQHNVAKRIVAGRNVPLRGPLRFATEPGIEDEPAGMTPEIADTGPGYGAVESRPSALEIKKSMQREAIIAEEAGKKVIMFVAMEGWSKSGGQADYIRELSQALADEGHMVIVINPYFKEPYADISSEEGMPLFNTRIPIGDNAEGLETNVSYNNIEGVHYLRFKDAGGLLFPVVYPQEKISGRPYSDSLYGYVEAILLSKAGMHITKELEIGLDILHFNDWQAGLGPPYMEAQYRDDPEFNKLLSSTGTVIITHNLAYQGVFGGTLSIPRNDRLLLNLIERGVIAPDRIDYHDGVANIDAFHLTNLPLNLQRTTEVGLEYWSQFSGGRHNFLKGGLEFADAITAVSEGNMQEIQTDSLGFGLGGIIARRAREGAVDYVYNGVRIKTGRPDDMPELKEVVDETRGVQFTQFSAEDDNLMQKRAQNKYPLQVKINNLIAEEALKPQGEQRCFGSLEEDRDAFMVTAVGRLVWQKGYSLLFEELDEDPSRGINRGDRLVDLILRMRGPNGEKTQFVLMGTPGDDMGREDVVKLRRLAEDTRYKGQVAFLEKFDPELANQINAGGDVFFMPSQYEPGGIANVKAALVGSLCIMTFAGGLVDFIKGEGTHPEFAAPPFDYDYPQTLKETVSVFCDIFRRAEDIYFNDKAEWERIMRKAMKFEADWSTRVPKYEKIYENTQRRHEKKTEWKFGDIVKVNIDGRDIGFKLNLHKEGYWLANRRGKPGTILLMQTQSPRNSIIYYGGPDFESIRFSLTAFDESRGIAYYGEPKFIEEIEAERFTREGEIPVTNIGFSQMQALFEDRGRAALNPLRRPKVTITTPHMSVNYGWESHGRMGEEALLPYGDYVFAVFPGTNIRVRPTCMHEDNYFEGHLAREYLTDDKIPYSQALLLASIDEYRKISEAKPKSREEALVLLGRGADEQAEYENRVYEEALYNLGQPVDPADLSGIVINPLYRLLLEYRAASRIEEGMLFYIRTSPEAEVLLTGEFSDWAGAVEAGAIKLDEIGRGIYAAVVSDNKIPPGTHKFKFIVNNETPWENGVYKDAEDEDGNSTVTVTARETYFSRERTAARLAALEERTEPGREDEPSGMTPEGEKEGKEPKKKESKKKKPGKRIKLGRKQISRINDAKAEAIRRGNPPPGQLKPGSRVIMKRGLTFGTINTITEREIYEEERGTEKMERVFVVSLHSKELEVFTDDDVISGKLIILESGNIEDVTEKMRDFAEGLEGDENKPSSAINWINLGAALAALWFLTPWVGQLFGVVVGITIITAPIIAFLFLLFAFLHEQGHWKDAKARGIKPEIKITWYGITIPGSSGFSGIRRSAILSAISLCLIPIIPQLAVPSLIINVIFALSINDLIDVIRRAYRKPMISPAAKNILEARRYRETAMQTIYLQGMKEAIRKCRKSTPREIIECDLPLLIEIAEDQSEDAELRRYARKVSKELRMRPDVRALPAKSLIIPEAVTTRRNVSAEEEKRRPPSDPPPSGSTSARPQLTPTERFWSTLFGVAVITPYLCSQFGLIGLGLAVAISVAVMLVGWGIHEIGHLIGGDFGKTNVREMRAGPLASLILFSLSLTGIIVSCFSSVSIPIPFTVISVPLITILASAAVNYFIHIFADERALFDGLYSAKGQDIRGNIARLAVMLESWLFRHRYRLAVAAVVISACLPISIEVPIILAALTISLAITGRYKWPGRSDSFEITPPGTTMLGRLVVPAACIVLIAIIGPYLITMGPHQIILSSIGAAFFIMLVDSSVQYFANQTVDFSQTLFVGLFIGTLNGISIHYAYIWFDAFAYVPQSLSAGVYAMGVTIFYTVFLMYIHRKLYHHERSKWADEFTFWNVWGRVGVAFFIKFIIDIARHFWVQSDRFELGNERIFWSYLTGAIVALGYCFFVNLRRDLDLMAVFRRAFKRVSMPSGIDEPVDGSEDEPSGMSPEESSVHMNLDTHHDQVYAFGTVDEEAYRFGIRNRGENTTWARADISPLLDVMRADLRLTQLKGIFIIMEDESSGQEEIFSASELLTYGYDTRLDGRQELHYRLRVLDEGNLGPERMKSALKPSLRRYPNRYRPGRVQNTLVYNRLYRALESPERDGFVAQFENLIELTEADPSLGPRDINLVLHDIVRFHPETEERLHHYLRRMATNEETSPAKRLRCLYAIKALRNYKLGQVVSVTPEVKPFSMRGGLANVEGELPAVMADQGNPSVVISVLYEDGANYQELRNAGWDIQYTGKLVHFKIGDETVTAGIHHCRRDGVGYYFLHNPIYGDRLYGGVEREEKLRRAIFLSKGALEVIKAMDLSPSVIDTHDWMCGPLGLFLRHDANYSQDTHFETARHVQHIHNLGIQHFAYIFHGKFDRNLWHLFNLADDLIVEALDPDNSSQINMIYAAITGADFIIAVSEEYAREITTRMYGEALASTLKKRKRYLTGITNGVDLLNWQRRLFGRSFLEIPEPEIPSWMEAVKKSKAEAKLRMQHQLRLKIDPDAPVITMMNRVAEQKGHALVVDEASRLLTENPKLQIWIFGNADPNDETAQGYSRSIEALVRDFPDRVAFPNRFVDSAEVVYQDVYLAGDIYWVPTIYAPCETAQSEAMAAGQIAVATYTGGLKNTVFEQNRGEKKRNGYLFNYGMYTPDRNRRSFRVATQRAINAYNNRYSGSDWFQRQLNAITRDASWWSPALKYNEIFRRMHGIPLEPNERDLSRLERHLEFRLVNGLTNSQSPTIPVLPLGIPEGTEIRNLPLLQERFRGVYLKPVEIPRREDPTEFMERRVEEYQAKTALILDRDVIEEDVGVMEAIIRPFALPIEKEALCERSEVIAGAIQAIDEGRDAPHITALIDGFKEDEEELRRLIGIIEEVFSPVMMVDRESALKAFNQALETKGAKATITTSGTLEERPDRIAEYLPRLEEDPERNILVITDARITTEEMKERYIDQLNRHLESYAHSTDAEPIDIRRLFSHIATFGELGISSDREEITIEEAREAAEGLARRKLQTPDGEAMTIAYVEGAELLTEEINLALIIQGVLSGRPDSIRRALELLGKVAQGIRPEDLRRRVIDLRGYTSDLQDHRRAIQETKRAL